jgi:serine/threonine protein kinase/tetratricopeptide (TPR) repeat protein
MAEQPDDPVEALFDRASALPPEERAAFLDAACRGDPGLRAEVESLLAYDRPGLLADGLLKSPLLRQPENVPPGEATCAPPEGVGIPQRVGNGRTSDPEPTEQSPAGFVAAAADAAAPARSPAERATFSETSESAAPRPPVEIPGYLILGRLGGGGMGVVYKARHLRLGRLVALKMIRSGELASAAELARFRTEAQAAARLQHPNVVQIFEVGEVHGQPFFCMEYVEGKSLAELVNGTPWPCVPAARLVETLARAIDAAHRQAIIHRDLKPGNILLAGVRDLESGIRSQESGGSGEKPVGGFLTPDSRLLTPKITDFGLAKMLAGDQGQTETGAFLGSPSYAAPEQAGAHKNAIGPHTDLYALGAVLYELLTGRPPFKGATLLETIRQVLDQEPVPPRLLNQSVPPDLEAICLKCLEKGPARRYASAADLAEDLGRWQHHEPTRARPPGALGRAGRWCRRHPALTTVAAVIALGVLGMSWQWREAVAAGELAEERREAAVKAEELAQTRRAEADKLRKEAVEEAAVAREVAGFLGGLFEEADPFVFTGRVFGEQPKTNPSALDVVNRGARRLANPDMLKEKPLVRAHLLDKVGHVYVSLGQLAKAAPFVTEALQLRRQHLPAVHADLASSLHNAGFLHLVKGNYQKSQELFAAAAAMRTRLFGAASAQAMTSRFHLACAKFAVNDRSAEPLLLEAVQVQRARLKAAEKEHPEVVGQAALELGFTLVILCNFYAQQNQVFKALPYLLEGQGVSQKITNKEVRALASHLVNFRRFQVSRQVDQAAEELRRALEAIEKIAGKHHFLYMILQRQRAGFSFDNKRFEDAEKAYLDLEANYRQAAGADGPALADISYELARSIQRGKAAKARQANNLVPYREQAVRQEQYARAAYFGGKRDGAEQIRLGIYAVFLAHTLLYDRPLPDNAAAEEIARDGVRIRTAIYGVGHELTSHPRAYLLLALARQNKVEEIEETMLDLLARDPRPKWDPNAADALPEAARKLAAAGKTRTALLVLEQGARAGHYNLDHVRSDPAFAALRESEAYRQLLKKVPK